MDKISLLCEGGGTKAAYTAGVLQCFLDNGIEFPYTAGISAGSVCLMAYISKQRERLRITGVDSASRKEAVGMYPIMHEKAVFGVESTYQFLEKEAPLDYETFMKNPAELDIGLYNNETGEIEYFGKEFHDKENDVLLKAACSLLLLTHPLKFNGSTYMDGGLIDMIPIEQAIRKGCNKHVFISTKEENYVRKPAPGWQLFLAGTVYRKQKFIKEDLRKRHERYAHQWKIVSDLEKEGNALVLRPSKDMGITRYTNDKELLGKWFDLGYSDTVERMDKIKKFMNL